MERVPRHFGKVLHPRNSPLLPWRMTIGSPHKWHLYSVRRGFAFSPLMGRVYLHFFGWFSQATKGPKNPPRGSSLPPHSGHRSLARAERSYASAMRAPASTLFNDFSNGL